MGMINAVLMHCIFKYTMYGYCIDHPHFLPEGASVVPQISQQGNGFRRNFFCLFHITLGATYRQSFIEIGDIN